MKDLHSHLCFGIDDGCKTIDQSIYLLKKMANEGFTDIFLTPHYIEDTNSIAPNNVKRQIIAKLRSVCEEEGINVNLYEGNEVYLTDNFEELIENDEIMTLNGTEYILMEFSMHLDNPNIRTILHNVLSCGYIPIIAHPERYTYMTIDRLKELQDMGVLFQGNYLSLFDKYGKLPRKNLQKMLKENIISFLGSDIHHDEELHMDKVYKKIKKCVKSDQKVYDLMEGNIDKFILNK